jgi:hypothetical protein
VKPDSKPAVAGAPFNISSNKAGSGSGSSSSGAKAAHSAATAPPAVSVRAPARPPLLSPENSWQVAFEEDAYSVSILDSGDWAAPLLRLSYTSFTTPHTVLDIHMFTQRRVVRSVTAVGGGFRPTDYRSYRLWATADDGVDVPLSLVYRLDTFGRDGLNPALLMVYGAYGERQWSLSSRTRTACVQLCRPAVAPVLAHTLPLMYWRARAAFAIAMLCCDPRLLQGWPVPTSALATRWHCKMQCMTCWLTCVLPVCHARRCCCSLPGARFDPPAPPPKLLCHALLPHVPCSVCRALCCCRHQVRS